MIKGLTITPPVLGRISIGRVIQKDGKRLPAKDDQFTITSQVQNKDGWVNHPLDEKLRANNEGKLRQIPVRMLFNDPELNLRAEYTLFDRQTGRPLCVGDGEQCQRRTSKGVENHPNMLADVYWHTSKKVFLEMKNLPAAPSGKQYQLWAIVDGKPVDMGMYSAKADSTVQEMKSVDNAQAFAITLEKEGGNPTPTMEEMYVMGTI